MSAEIICFSGRREADADSDDLREQLHAAKRLESSRPVTDRLRIGRAGDA